MDNKKDNLYYFLLWAAIFIYVAIFFYSAVLRFFAFSYIDMDLAVYDQIIWNILHGSTYCSILGVDFLGHHAHFLAFPLAAVYKIVPHPLTLLFIQALVLGLGAHPVFLIARRVLDCRWALLISIFYLAYSPLGYTNAYEFHFTPFATLLLLYTFYFFLEKRYVAFILFNLLTLLCQENMSLVVIFLGFYALAHKRSPRWWAPLLIGGTLYFLFCSKFLLPSRNPDTIQFISIYEHWGRSYGQILKNVLTRPGDVFQYAFTPQKLVWLSELFPPVFLISFLSPLNLLPTVPLFLQHLLSYRMQETDIRFHYAAELIPFIMVAFIFGIRNLLDFKVFKIRPLVLMIVLILTATLTFVLNRPHYRLFQKSIIVKDQADEIKDAFLRMVPPDASLVTTFEFMPRVTHRTELYSFHHIYWGYYTLSPKVYPLPDRVDYALIDWNDGLTFGSFYTPDRYKKIQKFLSFSRLRPVAVRDNIVLFETGAKDPVNLYSVLQSPPDKVNEGRLFTDGRAVLNSVEISRHADYVEASLYWYALDRSAIDIGENFDFIDEQGRLILRSFSPSCYRIYPSQAWKKGEWVVDHKYLTIPKELRGRPFSIRMGFYDVDNYKVIGNSVEILNVGKK